MIGHLLVSGMDVRFVVIRFDYRGLGIVGYNEGGNPAYEGQGSAVGGDPGGKILGQAGFGIVVVAAPRTATNR